MRISSVSGVQRQHAVMSTEIGLSLITSFAALRRSAEVAPVLIRFQYQVASGRRLPSRTPVTPNRASGSDASRGQAPVGGSQAATWDRHRDTCLLPDRAAVGRLVRQLAPLAAVSMITCGPSAGWPACRPRRGCGAWPARWTARPTVDQGEDLLGAEAGLREPPARTRRRDVRRRRDRPGRADPQARDSRRPRSPPHGPGGQHRPGRPGLMSAPSGPDMGLKPALSGPFAADEPNKELYIYL